MATQLDPDIAAFVTIKSGGVINGLDMNTGAPAIAAVDNTDPVQPLPFMKKEVVESPSLPRSAPVTEASVTKKDGYHPLPPRQTHTGMVVDDAGGPKINTPTISVPAEVKSAVVADSQKQVAQAPKPQQQVAPAPEQDALSQQPAPNATNIAPQTTAPVTKPEAVFVDGGELPPPMSMDELDSVTEEPDVFDTVLAGFNSTAKAVENTQPATVTQDTKVVLKAVEKKFAGDEELDETIKVQAEIERQVNNLKYELGITLLSDYRAIDNKNVVHRAIFNVRWCPMKMPDLPPQNLCAIEAALTAHQVYVQSVENDWSAKYRLAGEELSRVMRAKRPNYNDVKTKGEQDDQIIMAEPRMRKLRNDFLLAQAMSMALKDMGARFAQLEDGIKRTISLSINQIQYMKKQNNRTM